MTMSQMPTTSVNVAIDSNGDASITMPASRLTTPMKISQPRPGSVGSLIAETAVATPRKMKPTPIQIASNRMDSCRLRKHSTARIRAAAPLMNSRTRPPAETSRLNAKITCAIPVINR